MASIDSNGQCFSRQQSSVTYLNKNIIQWPKQEQHLLYMQGSNGHIVLNVVSPSLFSVDKFLGQAVLDMKDRQQKMDGVSPYFDVSALSQNLMFGDRFVVNVPISDAMYFPMHETGHLCGIHDQGKHRDNGILTMTLSLPPIFTSLCGTFYERYKSLFGVIERKKVWVVMHDSRIQVYSDRLAGGKEAINTIDLNDITYLTDYHTKESEIVGIKYVDSTIKDDEQGVYFKVKRSKKMELSIEEEFVWLWGGDTRHLKGLWKHCLSRFCDINASP